MAHIFKILCFIYSVKLIHWMHFYNVLCKKNNSKHFVVCWKVLTNLDKYILPNCTVRDGICSLLRAYCLTWKKYKWKGIFLVLFLNMLTKSRRIQYLLRMQNLAFLFQNPLVAYLIYCFAYIIYIYICKICLQIGLFIKPLYNNSRLMH